MSDGLTGYFDKGLYEGGKGLKHKRGYNKVNEVEVPYTPPVAEYLQEAAVRCIIRQTVVTGKDYTELYSSLGLI